MAFSFNSGEQQFDQNQGSGQGRARKRFSFTPKLLIIAVIVILAIITLSTGFFVVDQTEQAVILRWGKYLKTVGPGLQFKIPFGVDSSYQVETQTVQTMSFGYRASTTGNVYGSPTSYSYDKYMSESTMLTGDLNIVDIQWIVQYRVDDPYKWLFNVNNQENTIRDISRSVINQLVGDLPILSIMTSERTSMEVEAQDMLQEAFDFYNLGIKILTVKLQDIVPPAGDVQDAFEDVNKAIQDMNKYINEGKENYNRVIPAAEGEANKVIQEAQGYASERVNTATGDVARFKSVLSEYEKSPEITAQRLYIETMEKILADGENLTVVDKNLENFLPMMNLTKEGN
ncbi:MAG: FtsH protease activity modulator HflK [Spirochaetales bacterium]|nr:FtsH protease activity modulator HflK [Spirochaetales bacterium]